MSETAEFAEVPVTLPEGEYAIVELMGHVTLVGRISEVERFGSKLLMVEPLFQSRLLTAAFYGSAAIYSITPCTAERALNCQPKQKYSLPRPVALAMPVAALPAPESLGDVLADQLATHLRHDPHFADEDDDDAAIEATIEALERDPHDAPAPDERDDTVEIL